MLFHIWLTQLIFSLVISLTIAAFAALILLRRVDCHISLFVLLKDIFSVWLLSLKKCMKNTLKLGDAKWRQVWIMQQSCLLYQKQAYAVMLQPYINLRIRFMKYSCIFTNMSQIYMSSWNSSQWACSSKNSKYYAPLGNSP